MELKRTNYDILELQKMALHDLRLRAASFGIEGCDEKKRNEIMYAILDRQDELNKKPAASRQQPEAKIYNDRSEFELLEKVIKLEEKHMDLLKTICEKIDMLEDRVRQIHILEHKIEVARQRLAGEWVSDHPETAHTRVARVSDNIHSLNK